MVNSNLSWPEVGTAWSCLARASPQFPKLVAFLNLLSKELLPVAPPLVGILSEEIVLSYSVLWRPYCFMGSLGIEIARTYY